MSRTSSVARLTATAMGRAAPCVALRAELWRGALRAERRRAGDGIERRARRRVEKFRARGDRESGACLRGARRAQKSAERCALRRANPRALAREPRITPLGAKAELRSGLDIDLCGEEAKAEAFRERAVEDLLIDEALRQQSLVGEDAVASREARALLQHDPRDAEVEQEGDFDGKLRRRRSDWKRGAAQPQP